MGPGAAAWIYHMLLYSFVEGRENVKALGLLEQASVYSLDHHACPSGSPLSHDRYVLSHNQHALSRKRAESRCDTASSCNMIRSEMHEGCAYRWEIKIHACIYLYI